MTALLVRGLIAAMMVVGPAGAVKGEPAAFAMDLLEAPRGISEAEPVLFSSSRRIRLQNLHPADAMVLARWAEDIMTRFEEKIGEPLLFHPGEAVTWRAVGDDASSQGRVVVNQAMMGQVIHQHLTLIHPGKIDPGHLLDGFVRLLTSRAMVMFSASPPEVVPDVPAWLAAGMTDLLFAERRNECVAQVRQDWERERSFYLVELLAWTGSDTDDEAARGWVGALVAWIYAEGGADALRHLFQAAAVGPVREDILARALGMPGEEEMAVRQGFDLWLARQQDRILPRQAAPYSVADRVEAALDVEALARVAHPGGAAVMPRSLEDMIEHRDDAWVRRLAMWMARRLKSELVVADPDLAGAAQHYLDVLDQIAGERSHDGEWMRWREPPGWTRHRLERAHVAWSAWREIAAARRSFVDRAEARDQQWLRIDRQETWSDLEPARRAMLQIMLDRIETERSFRPVAPE